MEKKVLHQQKDKDGLYQRQATGFMGKEWDGGDIAFRKETWELAYKLLKPGGHLLAFSASRNYHRMAVAIEDAGFEIRDQIMWIYGSGFPKSLNLGDGWGTALKIVVAHEPIVMAKKRLEGTNKQNKDKYGTGGINIDKCRVQYADENDRMLQKLVVVEKVIKIPTFKIRKITPEEIQERTKDGRFPANVMHGGLETEWARYFYCPKTSKSERNVGLDNFTAKPMHGVIKQKSELKRGNLDFKGNQGDGSKHNKVEMRLNTHPTVKPVELMKYLCRLVTPKGGVVLDPFMGSGSTGMVQKMRVLILSVLRKMKNISRYANHNRPIAPLMDFM